MNPYGVHETLDLHEIAAFKAVCLTKSKVMQLLVSDPDLKALMRQDVETSTRHLQELGGLLTRSIQ